MLSFLQLQAHQPDELVGEVAGLCDYQELLRIAHMGKSTDTLPFQPDFVEYWHALHCDILRRKRDFPNRLDVFKQAIIAAPQELLMGAVRAFMVGDNRYSALARLIFDQARNRLSIDVSCARNWLNTVVCSNDGDAKRLGSKLLIIHNLLDRPLFDNDYDVVPTDEVLVFFEDFDECFWRNLVHACRKTRMRVRCTSQGLRDFMRSRDASAHAARWGCLCGQQPCVGNGKPLVCFLTVVFGQDAVHDASVLLLRDTVARPSHFRRLRKHGYDCLDVLLQIMAVVLCFMVAFMIYVLYF